jgi:hypothetical protein
LLDARSSDKNIDSGAAQELPNAGIPAAALAPLSIWSGAIICTSVTFGIRNGAGVLPGLPGRASFGQISGPAPGLGVNIDTVLRDLLEISPDGIVALYQSGGLGRSLTRSVS